MPSKPYVVHLHRCIATGQINSRLVSWLTVYLTGYLRATNTGDRRCWDDTAGP